MTLQYEQDLHRVVLALIAQPEVWAPNFADMETMIGYLGIDINSLPNDPSPSVALDLQQRAGAKAIVEMAKAIIEEEMKCCTSPS